MFEGNKQCAVCNGQLTGNKKNFGMSLSGYTYEFCDNCFKNKKENIKAILHK